MEHEIDRIECAIRHIESSFDVDPWACEIAVHAMRELIKRTETCPEFAKDINVPTNDDTISRKSVIDAVHTATYGFICGAEDGDEMTDEDKLVLSINKAICTAIKALPTEPNTFNALSALDCVGRQAAVDAIRATDDYSNVAVALGLGKAITAIRELPSVQPERMTNRQWIDFLSVQFDISRTSAKEMLHGMMQWKKEDNFKKLFNGGGEDMNQDLISRQAILKHIEKIRQGALMMDDTRRASIIMNGMNLCEEAVRNQPSVQPEHTETHSCDCEHTETHDSVSRQSVIDSVCEVCENCEYFKNEKLIQTIKDLPSAQPRWIPVTPETLPNLNSVVVVCGKKGTWLGINQEEGQDD